MSVSIFNHHPHLDVDVDDLVSKVELILKHLQLIDSTIELTLVTDDFMIKQNQKFRGEEKTTDVLSFAQISADATDRYSRKPFCGEFLGDVLISLDQAQKQAVAQQIDLQREVVFLVIHSILHLIGYDHAEPQEQQDMQGLEQEIFKRLYGL